MEIQKQFEQGLVTTIGEKGKMHYADAAERARKYTQHMQVQSQLAGQEFVAQTKLSTEMRKTESRTISAENARERAMDRAARMEKNNQDVAANNLRRRTEEKFMREMDKLGPAAEKGSEQARKMLEDGGSTNKDSVTEGGDAAKKALEEGAEAIKDATGAGAAQVAPVDPLSVLNEIKLFLTQTFFTDFKKRLPQNALG
jgi:hypothetical protein